MWNARAKIIYSTFIIWTIMVLFIVYRNIEFPFAFQFIIGYVIFLMLVSLHCLINIFLNMRKSKWSTIRKKISTFIMGALIILALNVLFIYLVKGELRITYTILNAIVFSFALTFGEMMFKKRNI
ncbi:hypothetical protein SDC9_150134 [bioreactor metagenome]|uniref:Uncharacterized protein n=1 Tax=bioreactor metagenome TaxID=1076179 RepID=A0A645EQW0_9ZZZZ